MSFTNQKEWQLEKRFPSSKQPISELGGGILPSSKRDSFRKQRGRQSRFLNDPNFPVSMVCDQLNLTQHFLFHRSLMFPEIMESDNPLSKKDSPIQSRQSLNRGNHFHASLPRSLPATHNHEPPTKSSVPSSQRIAQPDLWPF